MIITILLIILLYILWRVFLYLISWYGYYIDKKLAGNNPQVIRIKKPKIF